MLAVNALRALVARETRQRSQAEVEQAAEAVDGQGRRLLSAHEQHAPASTLHVLRWLPLFWVLLREDGASACEGGGLATAALDLLLDVAREWPDVFVAAITGAHGGGEREDGSRGGEQVGLLCRLVRTSSAALVPRALDLISALLGGGGDLIPLFLASGGVADLLAVRMASHPAYRDAVHVPAPPDESSTTSLQLADAASREDAGRQALRVLHQALGDRMHGTRVRSELRRWVPGALVAEIAAAPDAASALIDAHTRSPELIWNSTCVSELRAALAHEYESLLAADPSACGVRGGAGGGVEGSGLGAGGGGVVGCVEYSEHRGLTLVGEVFLEELIKEPGASLHDAAGLVDALIRCLLDTIAGGEEGAGAAGAPGSAGLDAELSRDQGAVGGAAAGGGGLRSGDGGVVYEAVLVLLRARPGLAASVARTGLVKALVRALSGAGAGEAVCSKHEDAMGFGAGFEPMSWHRRLLELLSLLASDAVCAEAMVPEPAALSLVMLSACPRPASFFMLDRLLCTHPPPTPPSLNTPPPNHTHTATPVLTAITPPPTPPRP